MEVNERVSLVERDISHIKEDIVEIRQNIREIRSDITSIRQEMHNGFSSQFRWIAGMFFGSWITIILAIFYLIFQVSQKPTV